MSSANSKPVKIHEFTAESFVEPGEHILVAIIIGPDRDDPKGHTLHMRANMAAVELLRVMPRTTSAMILEHQERLLAEFRKLINGSN